MKKFKFLATALVLLFACNLSAQDAEPKTESQKEESKPTVADASITAKEFTSEMIQALGITDENVIKTITDLNVHYESSFLKATTKGDLDEEGIALLKTELEGARTKRFMGILTPEQMKAYTIWQQKRSAKK